MSNDKEATARFKENMGSFFHDMMRAAGMTMVQASASERVRATGERMASAIEAAATRKSIQVIRTLQTAVTDAFVAMEKVLAEVKMVALANSTKIEADREEIARLHDHIKAIEDALLARPTDSPE